MLYLFDPIESYEDALQFLMLVEAKIEFREGTPLTPQGKFLRLSTQLPKYQVSTVVRMSRDGVTTDLPRLYVCLIEGAKSLQNLVKLQGDDAFRHIEGMRGALRRHRQKLEGTPGA